MGKVKNNILCRIFIIYGKYRNVNTIVPLFAAADSLSFVINVTINLNGIMMKKRLFKRIVVNTQSIV